MASTASATQRRKPGNGRVGGGKFAQNMVAQRGKPGRAAAFHGGGKLAQQLGGHGAGAAVAGKRGGQARGCGLCSCAGKTSRQHVAAGHGRYLNSHASRKEQPARRQKHGLAVRGSGRAPAAGQHHRKRRGGSSTGVSPVTSRQNTGVQTALSSNINNIHSVSIFYYLKQRFQLILLY